MAVPGEQESFQSQTFSGSRTSNKPTTSSNPMRTFRDAEAQSVKALQDRREATRQKFFKGREDISDARLDRRQIQDDLYEKFKKENTKLVEGTTNLYQDTTLRFDTDPSSPTFGQYTRTTLADKAMELANKYGPTFTEIASDMGYAIGSIAKGVAEKGIGLTAILKGVSNKFSNDANKNYNNLNDVSKEIADNPSKYPLTSSGLNSLQVMNNNERLALEAQRDAQKLRDAQKFAFAEDASGVLGIDRNRLDRFVNEPVGTFGEGLTKLPAPKISVDTKDDDYVESGQFKKDLQKSGIISVDDPSTQEPLPDSTKIPGYNATIGILKERLKAQGLDDLQIQSTVNQVTQQILSGDFTGDVEVETGSTTRGSELPNAPGGIQYVDPVDQPIDMSTDVGNRVFGGQNIDVSPGLADTQSGFKSLEFDDILGRKSSGGTQVTAFNNPVNLMDVGQRGTTGETYGDGFAVFPNAETGILAAKNDLRIKTDRFDGDVEKIIGQFSPRVDNPDSFDNYINFVKQGVGDRVDPGEEDELLKRVIQFENKPDIAQQYLALVAEGGLMDKKMYGGIIASKG